MLEEAARQQPRAVQAFQENPALIQEAGLETDSFMIQSENRSKLSKANSKNCRICSATVVIHVGC
jgi:hypothetical protein